MYQKYVNDPDQWEQMKSIAMLAFLCVHGHSQFDVSLENFKLILNIHFAIECNSFGVSKSDQIRCGTGLYYPTNFINHSCNPNAFIRFSGKRQYLIANQDIAAGEQILISYVDHGHPEKIYRQRCLEEGYHFKCDCARCEEQSKEKMGSVIIHSLNECGEEVKDLNERSLELEKGGSFAGSFELI